MIDDILFSATLIGRQVGGGIEREEAESALWEYTRRTINGETIPGCPLRFVMGRVKDRTDRLPKPRKLVRWVRPKEPPPAPVDVRPVDSGHLYWRFVPLGLAVARKWWYDPDGVRQNPGWERQDFEQEALCHLRDHAIRMTQTRTYAGLVEELDTLARDMKGRVRKGIWTRLQRERKPWMYVGRDASIETVWAIDPGDGDDRGDPFQIEGRDRERPLDALVRKETRARLTKGLTDRELAVLYLTFWQGWGPKRIAEWMVEHGIDTNEDNVTACKRRLFGKIRGRFSGVGRDNTLV